MALATDSVRHDFLKEPLGCPNLMHKLLVVLRPHRDPQLRFSDLRTQDNSVCLALCNTILYLTKPISLRILYLTSGLQLLLCFNNAELRLHKSDLQLISPKLGIPAPWFQKPEYSLTIANSLLAGSEGCAPTPSQYFALAVSSLMSLKGLPRPSGCGLGMGSYVPRTSMGLLFRAVLVNVIVSVNSAGFSWLEGGLYRACATTML